LQAGLRAAREKGDESLVLPDGWGKSWRLNAKRLDTPALNMGLHQAVGIHIEGRDVFTVPSEAMLADLFTLTPAESALYHQLVMGHPIKRCSAILGIAENTARKQLATIFRKTGCNRQVELIRLASGL
jgi:DNA-binding CsgD family transcriptional regulator